MFYLSVLGLAAAAAAKRPPTHRPNFVMLFVDDFGYGDAGFNGNTSVSTPNIDALAFSGRVLTTWYSGCPICTGSRAALMTGRQYPRTGLPAGIGPVVKRGLPLTEMTLAEQLKKNNYTTGIIGKWHLGQRKMHLPNRRGFDHYLGIPFSNDMGLSWLTGCKGEEEQMTSTRMRAKNWHWDEYYKAGYMSREDKRTAESDPGALFLPLVRQVGEESSVLEQPLDLTSLGEKYSSFAVEFIQEYKDDPFFLYVPFSHVHTAYNSKDGAYQYAGCKFRGRSSLGPFGDALAETDWVVGNIHKALQDAGIEENTLILFTGDNGPWMQQGNNAGSTGILKGQAAGYWNVGKGSTWEGGIRSASFAYWKGQIQAGSTSSQVVSSLDVFPTLSKLAGVPMPTDRVFDGHDMSEVLFQSQGKSQHEFLFFYGGCRPDRDGGPAAVRHGQWKAHFCTGPGLGGCEVGGKECEKVEYDDFPLLFDVVADPGESKPLNEKGRAPTDSQAAAAMDRILEAHKKELATFKYGTEPPEDFDRGEKPWRMSVCCSRHKLCFCPASKRAADEKWFPAPSAMTASGSVLAAGTASELV
mmetsp:Transcript_137890/g.428501  ORF Transcript_137890/g.428501 Transcript_137890/m.428501 type:complete len:582 (+) Transcript_137890:65-1810(+)